MALAIGGGIGYNESAYNLFATYLPVGKNGSERKN
jgi:hypothetical protein